MILYIGGQIIFDFGQISRYMEKIGNVRKRSYLRFSTEATNYRGWNIGVSRQALSLFCQDKSYYFLPNIHQIIDTL